MANNRMFIQCKICGEELMIAKYWLTSNWAVWGDNLPKIQRFLDEHTEKHILDGRFNQETIFKLAYEITEDDKSQENEDYILSRIKGE